MVPCPTKGSQSQKMLKTTTKKYTGGLGEPVTLLLLNKKGDPLEKVPS